MEVGASSSVSGFVTPSQQRVSFYQSVVQQEAWRESWWYNPSTMLRTVREYGAACEVEAAAVRPKIWTYIAGGAVGGGVVGLKAGGAVGGALFGPGGSLWGAPIGCGVGATGGAYGGALLAMRDLDRQPTFQEWMWSQREGKIQQHLIKVWTEEDPLARELLCSISWNPVTVPMTTLDGRLYEQHEIAIWLKKRDEALEEAAKKRKEAGAGEAVQQKVEDNDMPRTPFGVPFSRETIYPAHLARALMFKRFRALLIQDTLLLGEDATTRNVVLGMAQHYQSRAERALAASDRLRRQLVDVRNRANAEARKRGQEKAEGAFLTAEMDASWQRCQTAIQASVGLNKEQVVPCYDDDPDDNASPAMVRGAHSLARRPSSEMLAQPALTSLIDDEDGDEPTAITLPRQSSKDGLADAGSEAS